jgi:hypothetical protein
MLQVIILTPSKVGHHEFSWMAAYMKESLHKTILLLMAFDLEEFLTLGILVLHVLH